MLKINKLIAVVMVILLLFSSIQNIVQAVTLNQDVNIYNLGECEQILKEIEIEYLNEVLQ